MNIAQHVGAVALGFATRLSARLRAAGTACWGLIGSRQVFHGLVAAGLVVLAYAGQQAFFIQRYLGAIAEAQQISSYATMRHLQALGWTPAGTAPAAAAPSATPHTIDPSLLEHDVTAPGVSAGATTTVVAPPGAVVAQVPGK
ncbi:MAG TPA: hypothetical protein VHX44_04475 [Planctomycetota bacterium]|nr:hypothetical protein [Planctomycetota bacterium]